MSREGDAGLLLWARAAHFMLRHTLLLLAPPGPQIWAQGSSLGWACSSTNCSVFPLGFIGQVGDSQLHSVAPSRCALAPAWPWPVGGSCCLGWTGMRCARLVWGAAAGPAASQASAHAAAVP